VARICRSLDGVPLAIELAEAGDAGLRTARQGRWVRGLVAEQDNVHAALRWTIARGDGDAALRFIRALSWYWQLRGQPGSRRRWRERCSRSRPGSARRAWPRPG
jgi:hypothetical protein